MKSTHEDGMRWRIRCRHVVDNNKAREKEIFDWLNQVPRWFWPVYSAKIQKESAESA